MGVANSPDIFQQKKNNLFQVFEFIFAYMYEILILKIGDWKNYVQKLEWNLNKLKESGLKCITGKYFF